MEGMTVTTSTKIEESDIPRGQWILITLEPSPLSFLPSDAIDFDDERWNITRARAMWLVCP
jgi:hypothetical protein